MKNMPPRAKAGRDPKHVVRKEGRKPDTTGQILHDPIPTKYLENRRRQRVDVGLPGAVGWRYVYTGTRDLTGMRERSYNSR